jgi:hypothetical protein
MNGPGNFCHGTLSAERIGELDNWLAALDRDSKSALTL